MQGGSMPENPDVFHIQISPVHDLPFILCIYGFNHYILMNGEKIMPERKIEKGYVMGVLVPVAYACRQNL